MKSVFFYWGGGGVPRKQPFADGPEKFFLMNVSALHENSKL